MGTPTAIAAYVALFALTGFLFLFANLVIGWLVRPRLPNAEKLETYECGEPTIGSSFVQFDLRFYVVALLFIIFDVEVAFFFPWAAVFGKATKLAATGAPVLAADLDPNSPPEQANQLSPVAVTLQKELGLPSEAINATIAATPAETKQAVQLAARNLARASFADIAAFFFVLLVGFAYVWRRGDLDWVRAVTRQQTKPANRPPPARPLEPSQSILSA